jgi:hypothetical protein
LRHDNDGRETIDLAANSATGADLSSVVAGRRNPAQRESDYSTQLSKDYLFICDEFR